MSYMSTFRRRLRKMESQGFVIPKYIKDIKLEKTARKYTYEKIAQKSKYKETYKGKERIVSGAYGLEKLRSESARKAFETKKRKEKEREEDFWRESPGGWDISDSEDEIEDWEERKEELKRNIEAILHSFRSEALGNMIKYLFNKREREDGSIFWSHVLGLEDKIISKLQGDALIPSGAKEMIEDAYEEWISVLNYGTAPTLPERQSRAETAEEDETYEDEEM